MLDCSKVDTEVSDVGIESAESDNCKEVSGNNRDTNDVLATIQEEARLSHKDGWKFISLFTQSISKLY